MNRLNKIIVIFPLYFQCYNFAYAAGNVCTSANFSKACTSSTVIALKETACKSSTNVCVTNGSSTVYVQYCPPNYCNTGYYTVSKTDLYLCSNTSSPYNGYYTTCAACSCSNCTSDTGWSASGTGYQKKLTKQCICTSASNGTCSTTKTEYRCAAGYYGTSTNGTSGCSPCSNTGSARKQYGSGTNIYPTSDAGDNATINKCYYPTGTYQDSAGTYTISSKCYYE